MRSHRPPGQRPSYPRVSFDDHALSPAKSQAPSSLLRTGFSRIRSASASPSISSTPLTSACPPAVPLAPLIDLTVASPAQRYAPARSRDSSAQAQSRLAKKDRRAADHTKKNGFTITQAVINRASFRHHRGLLQRLGQRQSITRGLSQCLAQLRRWRQATVERCFEARRAETGLTQTSSIRL